MGKLLSSPKLLALPLVSGSTFNFRRRGSSGASFGFGWFGGPIPFISLPAERVAYIGSYPLLNTTVMFWFGGLILIFLAWRATRKMSDVPSGLQNLFEVIYEFFGNTVDGVAGGKAKAGRRFLALVSTIFLVVVIINWVGILPGVGSVGRIETIEEWVHHHLPKVEAKVQEKHPEYTPGFQTEAAALVHLLEDHGEDTFVAFDGSIVPLGRGEQARVPLNKIITFSESGLHQIEEAIHDGDDLDGLPLLDSIHSDIKKGVVQGEFVYKGQDFKGKTVGLLVPFLRGASTDINTTLAMRWLQCLRCRFGVSGHWGFVLMVVSFLSIPFLKGRLQPL
ncbi:MAG: hypothetical protein CM1200mP39_21070 [Dehalococcoidia bacterium]|nr:MAG: hypothetical protein CM1200mP39_21070 [Dehalococcoidia bacterium]